jgi:hypothetical protein
MTRLPKPAASSAGGGGGSGLSLDHSGSRIPGTRSHGVPATDLAMTRVRQPLGQVPLGMDDSYEG